MYTWSQYIPYNEVNAEKVPANAGVYEISVRLQNGLARGFYTGQANNLQRRYSEHLSENENNKCIKEYLGKFNCFSRYIEIFQQSERDRIEENLLAHGNYECNQQQKQNTFMR